MLLVKLPSRDHSGNRGNYHFKFSCSPTKELFIADCTIVDKLVVGARLVYNIHEVPYASTHNIGGIRSRSLMQY
jgi:hypothetical protein